MALHECSSPMMAKMQRPPASPVPSWQSSWETLPIITHHGKVWTQQSVERITGLSKSILSRYALWPTPGWLQLPQLHPLGNRQPVTSITLSHSHMAATNISRKVSLHVVGQHWAQLPGGSDITFILQQESLEPRKYFYQGIYCNSKSRQQQKTKHTFTQKENNFVWLF